MCIRDRTGTKTGKNREKPGKTGGTGRSSKNRETGKPGKTGKNREKPGKTGSTGHETGRAMPREFNTHIPVLWPAVGYVSVALVRASSAQTGERLAASSRVCTNFTVGGHVHCTGSDAPRLGSSTGPCGALNPDSSAQVSMFVCCGQANAS